MHKYFRFPGLFLFILALFVYGCSGSSADPMGTGTIQFVAEYSEPYGTGTPGKAIVISTVQVEPNSSLTLTVWVSNFTSDGKVVPVIGEKVDFWLDSPENGARLSVLNNRTGSNGEARIVYAAGNNCSTDVVRATTGVGATASITITKPDSCWVSSGAVVALSANPATVAPLGLSTITATVTDATETAMGAKIPYAGARVTFTLLTNNEASLSVQSGITDASGQVTIAYRAGNNYNQDVIQATLANGAAAQLMMVKTGGLFGPRISFMAASSTSVAEGQTSVITATVTDGNGNPEMGEGVTFTLATNDSGACFINAANACVVSVFVNSDAGGHAVAVYQAGGNSPTVTLYDTVRATLSNGSTNSVTITRTGTASIGIVVTAVPNSVNAGQTSIITATLTGDDKVGVTVNFSMPVNNSGGYLSASSAVTDGSGKAVVSYVAGSNNPTKTVGDTVQAAVGSISGSAAISRTGTTEPPVTPLSIAVKADPNSVTAGNVSIVTATLTGDDNAGVTVTFTLPINNSGATLSASSAITDGAGNAVVTYTAGANNPTLTVSDTVRAAVGSISSSAAISRTGTTEPPITPLSITVDPQPTSVTAGQVSIITATLTGDGNAGVVVTFTLPVNQSGATFNQSGATLSSAAATTDGNGKAVVIYQPGATNPDTTVQDTVRAAVGTATDAKAITRTGSSTLGYSIDVVAVPSTLSLTNMNSVVTATVKNNAGTAISGVTVTFTATGVVVGTVSPASDITDGSGNAVTVFTGGAGVSGSTGVVLASITIGGNTYTDGVVIKNP